LHAVAAPVAAPLRSSAFGWWCSTSCWRPGAPRIERDALLDGLVTLCTEELEGLAPLGPGFVHGHVDMAQQGVAVEVVQGV
jgi:hypothetical protein